MISVSAREGGGDLETNFKLKMAIEKARSANMPKDNIERAIKRGTGELKDGAQIEEIIYEAYLPIRQESGPGQVAMLIKTATDNKNRTVGEVRHILTKNGGKIVASGSVGYLFETVGEIVAEVDDKKMDDLELLAIEAGANDIERQDGLLIIYTKANELKKVKEELEKSNLDIKSAEISFLPTQEIQLSEDDGKKYERLVELLDENDDVVDIYDNLS